MAHLIVLGSTDASAALPGLELLPHETEYLPASTPLTELIRRRPDLLFLDARTDLVAARNTAQALAGSAPELPVVMVLTEGGMAAVSPTWMVRDVCLDTVGPAELEARIRLACVPDQAAVQESVISCGGVAVDEAAWTARIQGQAMNLTYKEFELLRFMVQNAGRVFTRAQLLAEVWGYDYYGGTRTVDVHVRRLRAKLGADHEQLITTVRNVGYSFTEDRPESS